MVPSPFSVYLQSFKRYSLSGLTNLVALLLRLVFTWPHPRLEQSISNPVSLMIAPPLPTSALNHQWVFYAPSIDLTLNTRSQMVGLRRSLPNLVLHSIPSIDARVSEALRP
jgi:hypothetical protein